MNNPKKLSDEDQARVNEYLSRPNHQVERKPFRPWLLLGVILVVMTVLSLFSYWLAWLQGAI